MHLEKEEGASIDGGEGGMSEQAIASEEMKPVVRKSQEGAGALRRSHCIIVFQTLWVTTLQGV